MSCYCLLPHNLLHCPSVQTATWLYEIGWILALQSRNVSCYYQLPILPHNLLHCPSVPTTTCLFMHNPPTRNTDIDRNSSQCVHGLFTRHKCILSEGPSVHSKDKTWTQKFLVCHTAAINPPKRIWGERAEHLYKMCAPLWLLPEDPLQSSQCVCGWLCGRYLIRMGWTMSLIMKAPGCVLCLFSIDPHQSSQCGESFLYKYLECRPLSGCAEPPYKSSWVCTVPTSSIQ